MKYIISAAVPWCRGCRGSAPGGGTPSRTSGRGSSWEQELSQGLWRIVALQEVMESLAQHPVHIVAIMILSSYPTIMIRRRHFLILYLHPNNLVT